MKHVKRILAVLLSVFMVTGNVPEYAFAMETGETSGGVMNYVEDPTDESVVETLGDTQMKPVEEDLSVAGMISEELDYSDESENPSKQESTDYPQQESEVAPEDDVFVEESVESIINPEILTEDASVKTKEVDSEDESLSITRAEWIHDVVSLFLQDGESEYDPTYFSDYTDSDPYYKDVMQALSDGAISFSEGDAFEPELPATREFAAHTMNVYLGILLDENEKYTFQDAELSYPDDVQVAINRNWFTLEDGYFHGEKAVTQQEATFIIEDSTNLLSAIEIDTEYNSDIQFQKDVIEVPEGTEILFDTDDQITIINCPVEIHEDDTFIVYISSLPIAYHALSVYTEDYKVIISVERAGEEAYQEINEQGILELNEDNCEFIPLTEEEIEDLVGSDDSSMSSIDVQFQNGKLSVVMEALDGLKGEAYIQDLSLAHSFNENGYSVVLNGSWGYKGNITMSNSFQLPLGELRIFGIGAIKLSLDLTESMETSVDFGGTFSTGIAIDSDGTKRVIREFNTNNTNNVTIKGNLSLSFKVSAGVDILFLSADIYDEIKIETQYTSKVTYDKELDKSVHCQDFRYYILQNIGVEASYYSIWTGKKEHALNAQLELPEQAEKPFSFQIHFEDGVKVKSCNYGMQVEEWQINNSISTDFESTVGSDNRDRVLETDVTMPGDLVVEEDYTISNGVLDLNGHVLTIEGDLIQTGGEIYIHGGRLIVTGSYKIQGTEWKPSEGLLRMNGSSDQVDIGGDFIVQSNRQSSLYYGIMRLKGDLYQYDTNKVHSNINSRSSFTMSMCGNKTQKIHFDSPSVNNLGCLSPENNIIADSGISISGCSLNGHSLSTNGALKQTDGTFTLAGGTVSVHGNLQLESGTFRHNGGTVTVDGDMLIAKANSDGTYSYSGNSFYMESEDADLIINGVLITDLLYKMNCSAGTIWLKGDWTNLDPNSSSQSPYCYGINDFTVILNGSGTQRILSKANKASYINTIPILIIENSSTRNLITEGALSVGKLDADALSITAKNTPTLTIGTTTNALDISGDITLNVTEKAGGNININGNMVTNQGFNVSKKELTVAGNLKQTGEKFTTGDGTLNVGGDLQLEGGSFRHNGGTVTVDGDMLIAQANSNGTYSGSGNSFYMESEDADLILKGNLITYLYNSMQCSAGTIWLKGDWTNLLSDSNGAHPYCAGTNDFTVILNGSGTQRILNKAAYSNNVPILKIENSSARILITEGALSVGKLDANALSITAKNTPTLTIGTTTDALNISGDITLNVTDKAGGDINISGNMITNQEFKVSNKKLTVTGDILQTDGIFTIGDGIVTVGGNLQLEKGSFYHSGGTILVNGDMVIARASSDGSYSSSNNNFHMESEDAILSIEGNFVICLANPDHWPYGGGISCSSGTMYLKSDWINMGGAGTYSGSGNFTVVLNGNGTQRILNKATYQNTIPILIIEKSSTQNLITEGTFSIGKLNADALSITAKNTPTLTIGTTTDALDISGDITLNVTEKAGGNININGNMVTDQGFKVSKKELTVAGNLKQTGGTFTTGNGTLNVGGDLQLENGSFRHNGGTVTVDGDMLIAQTNSDGTYSYSNNSFYMESEDADLILNGDLITDLYYSMKCSTGTIRLKGDWTNLEPNSGTKSPYCDGTNDFMVILNGSGTQRILNKTAYSNKVPILKIESSSTRNLLTEGALSVGKLDADALSITAKNTPALTIGTTTNALDISGDITLNVTEKAGGNININGNMVTDQGFKVSKKELTVAGNLKQTGGTFTTGNGTLNVGGDLQLENGSFRHNGGTVTVDGDMLIAQANSDGTYSYSGNSFYMESEDADLILNGDLITDLYYSMKCSAGTIRLKGDWTNLEPNSSTKSPYCYGTNDFTVILNGSGTQRILSKANKVSYINTIPILIIESSSTRNLITEGALSIGKLEADALSITAKNTPTLTIGTTTNALDISGDVTLNVTSKVEDNICVYGNVTSNNLKLSGKSMSIHGNFSMIESDTVKIGANGVLTIDGEFYHRYGTLNFDGGTIHVKGNYLSANRSSDNSLSSGSGIIYMDKASDLFIIEGDCSIFSGNTSKLTAGTMKIAGNFSQLSSNSTCFEPSGTHEVILNGTEKQVVIFTNSNSKFKRLYLEQDITKYEFSPDNCWDILEDNPYYNLLLRPTVYRVNLTPGEADLMPGDECQFIAKVIGFNNPSQSVTWTLTGNTSSSTTLSEDGFLMVAADEKSDQLIVTASALSDEEKTASAVVNVINTDTAPVVERIIVSSTATTVLQGESETFVAIVIGPNQPSQSVLWSLDGNTDPATFISNEGVLIIGDNEPVGMITVTATSAIDQTKHRSVHVKVVKKPVLHVSFEGNTLHEGDSLPALSLMDGDTEGTVSLDDDQELTIGRKQYRWTFIPNDKETYAIMTGIISLDVEERLLPIPEITQQPVSMEQTSGKKVSFTVTATGNGLTYQWQYSRVGSSGWTNSGLSSAKKSTLTFTMSDGYHGMRFRCIVANEYGQSVITNVVTSTLKNGPDIVTQPSSVEAAIGTLVSITISAKGDGLSYRWQYQKPNTTTWTNSGLSSATSSVLKFKMSSSYNRMKFRCIVTDESGVSVTSEDVIITALEGTYITTQPSDVSASAGTTVQLTALAVGTNLAYHWQYQRATSTSWSNSGLQSATLSTLSFRMSSGYDGMKFRCKITDSAGNVIYTDTAVITMVNGPAIIKHPEDCTTEIGSKAAFSIIATGNNLAYQWQYQKVGKTTWTNSTSSGNKTNSLKVSATTGTNGMKFRCVVTDADGNISISHCATLIAVANE